MIPLKIFSIRKNCIISYHSKIYPFSIITNSNIDSFTYVSYFCKINNTTIGKFCSIARNVKMGLGKHPTTFISTSPIFYSSQNPLKINITNKRLYNDFEPIVIGNDVWIGTNVIIMDGVIIGDGSIIGANSVVTKNIEPYTIVGGVPAKEIKKRFEPEVTEKLIKLKWWDYPLEILKEKSILELFSTVIDLTIISEIELRLKNR